MTEAFEMANTQENMFIIVNPIELMNAIEWALEHQVPLSDIHIVFLRKGAGRRKDVQTEALIRSIGFQKTDIVNIDWPRASKGYGKIYYYYRLFNCRKILDVFISKVTSEYNHVLSGRHPSALHLANSISHNNMITDFHTVNDL